ncbi:MAG: hypothetical protein MI757_16710 [Pirellulales bacterium]|nr:hypothetical protein [Pirellulales bacterium]
MSDGKTESSVLAGANGASSWKRKLLIGLAAVAILIALLPYIIAATPLRNRIINAVVADPDLSVATGGVSIGWFSPLGVSQLEVRSRGVHSEMPPVWFDVDEIKCDRSWLGLWQSLPDDAGTIQLVRPQLEVVLPNELPAAPEQSSGPVPTAKIVVDDASVKLIGSDNTPVIDLKGLSLTLLRTNQSDGGHVTIEPIQVFDRVQLTPELCNAGLQLIAPVVSNAAKVSGEVSFGLSKFDVPLAWNESTRDAIHVEGNVNLHSVDVGLKDTPWAGGIQLLATLLRIDMPESLRISEESDIRFAVRDGRIHHEGLAVGLPEVNENLVIRSAGSVGMDESLDLKLTIPVPRGLARRETTEPDTSEGDQPRTIVLSIRGTLDKPKIELPEDGHWASTLVNRILKDPQDESGEQPPVTDTVLGIVDGILEKRAERAESGESTTPLLDRLRKRREERLRRRP